MSSYLSLAEAAQYITRKTGKEFEPAALLRAGIHGALLIAAAFSGQARNLTAHEDEDVLGLLTVPPRHLLEIETDGKAVIKGAFSLDGKNCYAPNETRARDQLQVLTSELDRLIPSYGSRSREAFHYYAWRSYALNFLAFSTTPPVVLSRNTIYP